MERDILRCRETFWIDRETKKKQSEKVRDGER